MGKEDHRDPDNLRDGLQGIQAEVEHRNQAVIERLAIVDEQIQEYQKHLEKLLDLYLNGDFPKEVSTECKVRLEQMIDNLSEERHVLAGHI